MLHRALALAGLVLAISCSRESPEKSAPKPTIQPARVTVQPVAEESLERTVEVVGGIFAEERVTVSNEVPGTAAQIHADFGDIVEAGGLLLRLDPVELELQLGVAKAGLSQAEARLSKARSSASRARTLYPQEAISKERVDAVEADLRVAEADVEAARRQVALGENRLADAAVRAPFRAAVQTRLVSLGQYVPPFTPLFELVAVGKLKFRGEVPERFAPLIKVGLPLSLVVASNAAEAVSATVTRVATALTESTRTLPFESEFPDPRNALAPGLFARARIRLAPSPALLVPRSSVVQFAGVDRVFVVHDGKVEARTVTLGEQLDTRVEVMTGVGAGELVVTAGQDRLEDGLAVEVVEKTS